MRTAFIAAASAIFFAAVITELSSRLWPGSYLALLTLAAVTLFIHGLLISRLSAPRSAAARPERPKRERPAKNKERSKDDTPLPVSMADLIDIRVGREGKIDGFEIVD